MRQIHVGENLDGQVLAGPAHQSYFGQCSMRGATLTGEWHGTDFINCDLTAADLRAASLYSGYWRGCTLTGCRFMADIGWLHHEPVAEIIQQRKADVLPFVSASRRKVAEKAMDAVTAFVSSDYLAGSWVPSYDRVRKAGLAASETIGLFRQAFKPYERLAIRFEQLVRETIKGGLKSIPPMTASMEVLWLDGQASTLDAYNLPPLPRPNDRYELARDLERQVGAGHYCFVHSILPPVVQVLREPDDWLLPHLRIGGR